jgi:hypothetical protein
MGVSRMGVAWMGVAWMEAPNGFARTRHLVERKLPGVNTMYDDHYFL